MLSCINFLDLMHLTLPSLICASHPPSDLSFLSVRNGICPPVPTEACKILSLLFFIFTY